MKPLRKGGGLVDATGGWLVGAKSEYPLRPPFVRPIFPAAVHDLRPLPDDGRLMAGAARPASALRDLRAGRRRARAAGRGAGHPGPEVQAPRRDPDRRRLLPPHRCEPGRGRPLVLRPARQLARQPGRRRHGADPGRPRRRGRLHAVVLSVTHAEGRRDVRGFVDLMGAGLAAGSAARRVAGVRRRLIASAPRSEAGHREELARALTLGVTRAGQEHDGREARARQ
jgi:hypothetical protein